MLNNNEEKIITIRSTQELIQNITTTSPHKTPDIISINDNIRHHITAQNDNSMSFCVDNKIEMTINKFYWYFINDPVFINLSEGYSDTLCLAFKDKEHTQTAYAFVLTERV